MADAAKLAGFRAGAVIEPKREMATAQPSRHEMVLE